MAPQIRPDTIIVAALTFAACAALATAWIAQFGFGLYPCELCLFQRLPYLGVAAMGLLSLALPVDAASRRFGVQLMTLLFLATAATGGFHVGVEQGWWQSSCAPTGPQSFSFDDIQVALERPGTPACDDVPFTLFGLSMAAYNAVAGLSLSALCLWVSSKDRLWAST